MKEKDKEKMTSEKFVRVGRLKYNVYNNVDLDFENHP